MDIENKLVSKCIEWLDNEVDINAFSTIVSEDESNWNRRIYLIVWNDDDGYTHTYIIRVWTINNGNTINLSEDYTNCVKIEDFVDTIPAIVETINRIK